MISSIYLETDDLEALNIRLQEKYRRIEQNEQRSELYQAGDAEILLVGYGISGRLARTAVAELRKQGVKAGLLRPVTLFPFPADELRRLPAKQLIAVEMSNGQMIDDVKLAINCDRPVHLINRMGGNIPGVDEIVARTLTLTGMEVKYSWRIKFFTDAAPASFRPSNAGPARSKPICTTAPAAATASCTN